MGTIKGGGDPSPSAPSVGVSLSLPPVVLRVLPLQGSSAPVGFIYDATPDPIDGGLLAAASAFFTHQGHQVFHDPCPDFVAYCCSMGLQPSTVVPVDRLPDYLLSSGLDILAAAPSPTVTGLASTAFMAAYLSPSQPGFGGFGVNRAPRGVQVGPPLSGYGDPVNPDGSFPPRHSSSNLAVTGGSNPPLSTPVQTPSVGLSRSLHTEPGETVEGPNLFPSWLLPPPALLLLVGRIQMRMSLAWARSHLRSLLGIFILGLQ